MQLKVLDNREGTLMAKPSRDRCVISSAVRSVALSLGDASTIRSSMQKNTVMSFLHNVESSTFKKYFCFTLISRQYINKVSINNVESTIERKQPMKKKDKSLVVH